ncbi:hypothetical protein AEM38_01170 [Hyphomonadaceae bacterium UKL13-1]|nr:hypothetical protein AEM38_01170 [Hyphomonadaceae bacterium UKL13-1]
MTADPIVMTVPATGPGDVATVAAGYGQFNTLLAAANAAGLYDRLTMSGPITVFAPTDQAFANLPAGTLEKLLKVENRAALRRIVSYHIVSGRVPSSGLMGITMTSPTLEGHSVAIDGRNGVRVNNATVVQADIPASNGVIHAIDTVLMPADLPYIR